MYIFCSRALADTLNIKKNELQKILNSRFVSYVFRRAGERHNCYPPDV